MILMPQPSGHKSDKCQHLSGAGALYAMSEAMGHMAVGMGLCLPQGLC